MPRRESLTIAHRRLIDPFLTAYFETRAMESFPMQLKWRESAQPTDQVWVLSVPTSIPMDGWTFMSRMMAPPICYGSTREMELSKRPRLMSGAAYSLDGVARAGMGVAAGDFDNDGDEDVLVTNLAKEGSTLYRNQRGSFNDFSVESGLAGATFPVTGFGVGWFDYDNDGKLDLFAANGAVTIVEALRGTRYPFQQKNQLFHNDGERKPLVDVSATAGPAFEQLSVGRGAAFGDVDNDGDLDVLVSNNNGPVRLLLNEAPRKNHWLQVGLQAVGRNRQGIGARVAVLRKNQMPLWRHAHTDGSYLSAHDGRVHFGLGPDGSLQGILVQWPEGTGEVFEGIKPDAIVSLRQGAGKPFTGK